MSEQPPATPPSHGDDSPPPPPAPPAAAAAARAKQQREQAAPDPTPAAATDAPVATPQPASTPEPDAAPTPISLAGAGMPAFLGPLDPAPPAPQTAPEPPAEPAVSPVPESTPAPPAALYEEPAEQGTPAPAATTSTAPPGFTETRVLAAASPSLLAAEPSDDDAAPVDGTPSLSTESTEPPGLARLILDGLPRGADVRLVGRDRGATVRVVRAALIAVLLLFFLGPVLISGLERIGFMAQAIDHVRAILRFPGTYGMPWLTGIFGVISLVGVVLANMERYGERMGDRKEPVRRLNIGLGVVLSTALAGGLFASFAARGWAAAVAATTFWVLLCLLVPLGRTPGAWAMRYQSERGWALLFAASVAGVIFEPSLPGMLIAVLAFTRVRTNWEGVRDDLDHHAGGPVDTTNRRSALILIIAALLAGSIGLGSVSVNSGSLPTAETESPFPYAKEGETVDPDAVNPDGPSPTPEVPTSTPAAPAPQAPAESAPVESTPAAPQDDAATGDDAQSSTPDAPVESTPPPVEGNDASGGGLGVLR